MKELLPVTDCQGRRLPGRPPRFFIFLNGFGGNRTGKLLEWLCYKECFIFHGFNSSCGAGGEGASGLIQGGTWKIIIQKKKRKIRILGGGSNFSRRSLAVSFAPKAVASGWRKTASIPCKYAMKISINILSSRIRSRGVGPSNMAAHVP